MNFTNAFSLKDQVAVITGGGSGLGFSMAKCMSEAGAKVILIGRSSEEKLQNAVSRLSNASYYVHDVSKYESAPDLIEAILKDFGRIDILVNNAGVHNKKEIEAVSYDDFINVFNVHVFGSTALTQAVLPHMKKRKSGSILYISSMSAFKGLNKTTVYSAAKSSLHGIVRTIASEVSESNIRINAIAPGFIDTAMFRKATDDDPERQKKILGHTPMKRYGEPDDIGWGAVYLCSPASSFVTGTYLVIDGGFTTGF